MLFRYHTVTTPLPLRRCYFFGIKLTTSSSLPEPEVATYHYSFGSPNKTCSLTYWHIWIYIPCFRAHPCSSVGGISAKLGKSTTIPECSHDAGYALALSETIVPSDAAWFCSTSRAPTSLCSPTSKVQSQNADYVPERSHFFFENTASLCESIIYLPLTNASICSGSKQLIQ